MIFTPETAPSHCTGVLLADEVGLGKTFQACTVIGFLGELAVRQLKKLTLPPIIGR
jgi:TATA-binding protein-associated factor